VKCSTITGYACNFKIDAFDSQYVDFLKHINEVHDPQFIPKCIDDLRIEYQGYLEKIIEMRQDKS